MLSHTIAFPRGDSRVVSVLRAASRAAMLILAAAPLAAGDAPPRMFVTSTSGNGDFSTDGTWAETEGSGLTGFAAADKICQVRAENATPALASSGIPAFRAWVSIGTTDAYCHVLGLSGNRGNNCGGLEPFPLPGPYYRTDGVPFVDKLFEVGFGILGTASRNENGAFVSSVAWTGSNYDGTATASTCSGWDANTGFGSVGSTTSTLYWGEIDGDGIFGCGGAARLYCFEQPGVAPARPAWPEPAALVFLRTGGGSGDFDGIVGADIICQDQAADHRLPGAESFRAWLSDSDTNAKDGITIDGPWYRTDGVRVAASLAALTDGNLDSSIRLIPNGGPLGLPDRVWTGTLGNGNKASLHCLNWFTFDSEEQGFFGLTDETGNSWTAAPTTPDWSDACNQAGRFYCFGNVIVTFWDGFESGDALRWSARAGTTP